MDKNKVLAISQDDFLKALQTTPDGLSQKEAALRLKEYGPNQLTKESHHALRLLLKQFKSSLVYLLVAAIIISFALLDYSDGIIMVVILIINTTLSFFQEYRAERVIEKLSKLIGRQVRVKRNGDNALIDQTTVVPGDIVLVREGDILAADMRLLEADNLQINESQLTGESIPVVKSAPNVAILPATEICLLFTGSVVEKGTGTGVVYATGDATELGAIASLSTHTKKETQYALSLRNFSAFLIRVVLAGLALMFVFKLLIGGGSTDPIRLLLFIMALAIAVVPEALPVIATVTMANGALKLAKKHVVVKHLPSLEDLGNVTLLCTDKTGTITENKMVVHQITSADDHLFQLFAYSTIATLKGKKRRTENSYDNAFIDYVSDVIKKEAYSITLIKGVPFDPDARRSRFIFHDMRTDTYYLVVVGAPETLIGMTKPSHAKTYLDDIAEKSRGGLHHLAIAYAAVSYADGFDILAHENKLSFLGYVSFLDPLRPTTKNTLKLAQRLGIQIKILTGDSKEVAEYVGRETGLIQGDARVYTGAELDGLSEDAFHAVVNGSNVFARVSPSQKYAIIKILKQSHVVAYQGDGINDAPALKLADVAIAVNTATDIAKENADIVLLNKSLDVIINGIKYGRVVFVNVNKYVKYTMVGNFGNFIALGVLYLVSSTLPLLPVQVLLTSLITDVPLITIAADTIEADEIIRPEKHNPKRLVLISLILGVPTALFEIAYFALIHAFPQEIIATALFLFLTFLQLIAFFSIRTIHHFWNTTKPAFILSASFFGAFVISVLITYISPVSEWLGFVPLSVANFGIILSMTLAYFLGLDAVKIWSYKFLLIKSP